MTSVALPENLAWNRADRGKDFDVWPRRCSHIGPVALVDRGFAEIRGALDATASGQRRLANRLQRLIDQQTWAGGGCAGSF
ncbi:hypothetical protein [Mycobacterium kyorinense]|uniref:hypothetical protein n=1 Tax=Mycobacterium kyorinense TaxID=487514 RepID=UPI00114F25E3|nr:hypothetical protein [Mycobacterium kyorinense]